MSSLFHFGAERASSGSSASAALPAETSSDHASQDFRCSHCGDLLEIIYPHWKEKGRNAQRN